MEGEAGDRGHREHHRDMRDIQCPDPLQHTRGTNQPAGAVEGTPEGDRGGVAGNEEEHGGGVGESELAEGPVAEIVQTHVIDHDHEQAQPAREVEPAVAPVGADGHRGYGGIGHPMPLARPRAVRTPEMMPRRELCNLRSVTLRKEAGRKE